MKNKFILSIVALLLVCGLTNTKAWIYPEHRDIALIAIQNLSPEYRSTLDALWADAREGYEFRLSEAVIDATQSTNPTHLDYASWPAISGDHSCSAQNMLHNVLETEWILMVADITAKLKLEIADSKDRGERINALRDSDLKLQSADPEYATRAGSNNVHFLLSLPGVNTPAFSYILYCLRPDADANAIAAYAYYHYSALSKASQFSRENLVPKDRSALILAALADEAFALHFLEDVFAAGHVAGTRGDASQRKGTHDYYNEMGLSTSTWKGEKIVLTGDAWMRDEDAKRAALVVKLSIEQFLNAAMGKKEALIMNNENRIFKPDGFDVCKNNNIPPQNQDSNFKTLLAAVIINTPIPALERGLGELPRFTAEVGTFVGFSPSIRGYLINGGFGQGQETTGAVGGIEVAARFGVGLDGVLNESGDGLLFLAAGWRQDGSSTTGIVDVPGIESYGNLLAAIPGRSAFNVRLRFPFYLLPGDLLILGPMLFFIDEEALVNVGVSAVNGGLIPWQAGVETSFGRFQFVLGREISVYLFGRTKERDALFNISKDENGAEQLYVLSYRSTQFEFPFLEYRPISSFEIAQRSSLLIQFYGGFDVPNNVEVLEGPIEGESTPELKTVWYLGARLIFDWRHYF